ncbi:hypothetical protein ACS0TY_016366 [Phlomoides rotata]
MELPNQKWAEIIGNVRQSVDFLKDPDVIRAVLNILQETWLKLQKTLLNWKKDEDSFMKNSLPKRSVLIRIIPDMDRLLVDKLEQSQLP